MGMQTDVRATQPLTVTGVFQTQGGQNVGRTRIKAIYAICGASAGSVVFRNGSGGPTLFQLDTPTAANAGYVYLILPGEGILAENTVHGTVTSTTSVVVFYG
jgi:hypothetical protein